MTGEPLEQIAWQISGQPASLGTKLKRAGEIFVHYDKAQIFRRLSNVVKAKLQPGATVGALSSVDATFVPCEKLQSLAEIVLGYRKDHSCHGRCDLDGGEFELMNCRVRLFDGEAFDVDSFQQQSQLWRFHFHYHDYLMQPIARGELASVAAFLPRWLKAFEPSSISRRIIAWVLLESACRAQESHLVDGDAKKQLLNSLVAQCNYLEQNLEHDLGGNHLLENVTALALASQAVETADASSWRATAIRILKSELALQILESGEHYEVSPMYHCHVLGNLLRIKAACEGKDSELAAIVEPSIERMIEFLCAIVHPDGEIPLFADSGFHEAPSTAELFDCCDLLGYSLTEGFTSSIGGYEIFRENGLFAICDFGNIAADNLPAHGHCDATNIVVSVEGQRWIVDSGNFNYENDPMRHYCRSSIGHNVVTVDNANQANVWLKFRMGRRPTIFDRKRGSDSGWSWASAAHDGYAPLGTKRLLRAVTCRESALACFDRASGGSGELIGYLHFHPDVSVTRDGSQDSQQRLKLVCGSVERMLTLASDRVEVLEGWYCPEFGQRHVGAVVRYATDISAGILGWVLHEPGNNPEFEFNENEARITMSGQPECSLRL